MRETEVRERLEEIKREATGRRVGQVETIARLAREALALMGGEQGERITGFVREIGNSKQLFQFHVRQRNPKEIPYEGPMDTAILILGTESEKPEAEDHG